jgi:3-hydroxyacyl-[acyl-carrier-protein] dehydratase
VLVFRSRGEKPNPDSLYYYVGIDRARFKRPVVPGDQLELEVKMERQLRGIGRFTCEARVGGELAAEATILCAVGT